MHQFMQKTDFSGDEREGENAYIKLSQQSHM